MDVKQEHHFNMFIIVHSYLLYQNYSKFIPFHHVMQNCWFVQRWASVLTFQGCPPRTKPLISRSQEVPSMNDTEPKISTTMTLHSIKKYIYIYIIYIIIYIISIYILSYGVMPYGDGTITELTGKRQKCSDQYSFNHCVVGSILDISSPSRGLAREPNSAKRTQPAWLELGFRLSCWHIAFCWRPDLLNLGWKMARQNLTDCMIQSAKISTEMPQTLLVSNHNVGTRSHTESHGFTSIAEWNRIRWEKYDSIHVLMQIAAAMTCTSTPSDRLSGLHGKDAM